MMEKEIMRGIISDKDIRVPLVKIEMEHDLSARFSYTHLMNPLVSAENICRLTSHMNEIKEYVNENYDLFLSQRNDICGYTSFLNSKLSTIECQVYTQKERQKKDCKHLCEQVSKSSKRLDTYMNINDRMVVLNEKKIKGLTSDVKELTKELVFVRKSFYEEKEKRKRIEEFMYRERNIDYIWGFLLSCIILSLLFLK